MLAQQIFKLYQQGLTQPKIAKKLGMTQSGISYHLRKLPQWQPRGKNAWSEKRCRRAIALYNSGLTQAEVGKKLGSTNRRVGFVLHKYGVPIRPSYAFLPGKENISWTGGRNIDKSGYVLICAPHHPNCDNGGYVREHRLVMEKILHRFLDPKEVVHHKNGIRSDNRPENLELLPSNGEHLKKELTGHCPKWSKAGKKRILVAIHKPRKPWSLERRMRQNIRQAKIV
jgi:hypothetical protein